MVVLLKILQVILALSILIIVHEFGHFLFSKIFGIRVEKFYLFFDVGGVALFSTKKCKWLNKLFPKLKDAQTDYGIGWLPLGGYCKISGMVDESMDMEQLAQEPKPWEFRSHPAWQRILVTAGGVLFNFIFAIIVYAGLLCHNGTAYVANEGNSIYTNELSREMGFRTGDKILSFDDYVPENFGMLQADLARRSPAKAVVLRGNDTVSIYIDHAKIGQVLNSPDMFALAVPFVIDTLTPNSPNYGAGLLRGDHIIAIDGRKVEYVQDSRALLAEYAGRTVDASIIRGEDSLSLPLQVDSAGLIGIYTQIPGLRTRTFTFAQAIPESVNMTIGNIGGYVRDLKLVFTPSTGAYKSVGSFIAIGQVMPSAWDWTGFLSIIAILSIMLGVMNLIPIPGLDGGHIIIILYEMISGHKPSEKVLMVLQMIGMVLLILLMVLAFGNDITRLIK